MECSETAFVAIPINSEILVYDSIDLCKYSQMFICDHSFVLNIIINLIYKILTYVIMFNF